MPTTLASVFWEGQGYLRVHREDDAMAGCARPIGAGPVLLCGPDPAELVVGPSGALNLIGA
jgi:hypothetical protein